MKYRILVTASALIASALVAIPLAGCVEQKTLADLTQILGTSAANVAQLEGNTKLSQQLGFDTTAAVTAVTNWKSGTPAQDAIQALNIVATDLSLFPVANQYAPLIDLAIGTVDSILSMLPAPTPTTNTVVRQRVVHLASPPKTKAKFVKQWNDRATSSGLTAAIIK